MLKMLRENCKNLTLLYVEDDKELANKTKAVFENLFKSVDLAFDGREGLDKYTTFQRENGSEYDLVVTDVNMPHMNGIEMCKEILKRKRDQYTLIVSAQTESAYLFEAIDMGISSFISKPINQSRLMQALSKASIAINEHKLADYYLSSLEELTLQLETQNQELASKNAQFDKTASMLNTVSTKEKILHPTKRPLDRATDENSALMKAQINDFINDDFVDLIEILNDTDLVIIECLNNVDAITIDSIDLLASLLKRYSLALSSYPFFGDLSLAMSEFGNSLSTASMPQNKEQIKNCFLLLECFIFDLHRWHDDLSSGDERRFNTVDASNIGNMRLISNMWVENESDNQSDIGLDSIFDF